MGSVTAPAASAPAEPSSSTATAPARASLPERPSRADVRRALGGATAAVRACTAHRGVAMMSVTMSGEGEVLSARPVGSWAHGADAACLRAAIGHAQLPRFRRTQLTVQFPFVL